MSPVCSPHGSLLSGRSGDRCAERALQEPFECPSSTRISEVTMTPPVIPFHSLPTWRMVVSPLGSRRNKDAVGYPNSLERSTCMSFSGTGSSQIQACWFHLYLRFSSCCLSHIWHQSALYRPVKKLIRCAVARPCSATQVTSVPRSASDFKYLLFVLRSTRSSHVKTATRKIPGSRIPGILLSFPRPPIQQLVTTGQVNGIRAFMHRRD